MIVPVGSASLFQKIQGRLGEPSHLDIDAAYTAGLTQS